MMAISHASANDSALNFPRKRAAPRPSLDSHPEHHTSKGSRTCFLGTSYPIT